MIWKITDTNQLDKYSNKILDMYADSYKALGLIDFGGWEGLKNYLNCSCYLLLDETSDEINGIILYWLSDYGNKISLVISSNSEIGKLYVIPKLAELLKIPGFYIELSDALEYLIIKSGLQNIKNKETIKKIISNLSDEDIFDEGDKRCETYLLNKDKKIKSPSGSYLREIKDIGIHRKALYGLPCLSQEFDKLGCDRKCKTTIDGGDKRAKNIRSVGLSRRRMSRRRKRKMQGSSRDKRRGRGSRRPTTTKTI